MHEEEEVVSYGSFYWARNWQERILHMEENKTDKLILMYVLKQLRLRWNLEEISVSRWPSYSRAPLLPSYQCMVAGFGGCACWHWITTPCKCLHVLDTRKSIRTQQKHAHFPQPQTSSLWSDNVTRHQCSTVFGKLWMMKLLRNHKKEMLQSQHMKVGF